MRVIFLLFFLATSSTAFASTNRISLLFFRPAMGQEDLLSTLSPSDLDPYSWRFSTHFGYLHRPLQVDRNGVRFAAIVDHLFIQHYGIARSFNSWWEIEGDIPVIWANKFSPPTQAIPLPTRFKTDIGDLHIRQRFTFLKKKTAGVGFAAIPSFTIPTGREGHFVADKNPTASLILALDAPLSKRLSFLVNAGIEARERFQLFDFDLGTRLIFSSGFDVKMMERWNVKFDFYTATPLNDLYQVVRNSPTEALFGTNYRFKNSHFNAFLGGGFSVLKAVGSPRFRTLVGFSYTGEVFPLSRLAKPTRAYRQLPRIRDTDLLEMETGMTLYFDPKSADLTEENKEALSRVLSLMASHPEVREILIHGHSDASRSETEALALSLARAKRVSDYLIQKGFDNAFVRVEGLGAQETISGGKNNRVEIRITN